MKARLVINGINTGDSARNYLRLVKASRHHPSVEALDESHRREAQDILESIQSQNQSDDLDINITGKNLIGQMDKDFEDMGLIPYFFSNAARAAGEDISVGTRVSIPHDDRKFRTVAISRRYGSVRIRDADGQRISHSLATGETLEIMK